MSRSIQASTRFPIGSLLLVPLSALLLGGCGGSNTKAANTGGPQAVQCPPGQVFDGRYCVTQGAPPPTATTTGPPPTASTTAPPPVPPPSGPSATPLDATSAAAATQLLAPLAAQHAPPGAKPLGPAIGGQFTQGQQLEAQIQMQPGRCYTVVGVGLPPVQELDIQLVATVPVPGLTSPVIASDQTHGPNAVLGDKPNCFKWAAPFAAPVKVVVRVSAGQGVAAAQVFEK